MCRKYFEEDNCKWYPTDCYHCEYNYSYCNYDDDEHELICEWSTDRLIRWCNKGLFTDGMLKDALVELFYRGVAPRLIDNEVWEHVSDIHENAL